MNEELPLFPLRTVLFPGGVLPLRIFEPRYVDMISGCMREGKGFGVVLIREGFESRQSADQPQPELFDIGTEAEVTAFNETDHGILGIVIQGRRKFRIRSASAQADHLLVGQVQFEPEEPVGELRPEHESLLTLLHQLSDHRLVQKLGVEIDFGQARSVSWRLADLLPVEPEIKQALLQLRWPRERLNELLRIVDKLQQ